MRRRGFVPEVDEDATIGKIGPDFENCMTLSNSEVRWILDEKTRVEGAFVKKCKAQIATERNLKPFDNFKTEESVKVMRSFFSEIPLFDFEITQLANLSPDDVQEARVLVPSINVLYDGRQRSITDDELNDVLIKIQSAESITG